MKFAESLILGVSVSLLGVSSILNVFETKALNQEVKSTRDMIGTINSDTNEIKKEVGKLRTKVGELEKVVLYSTKNKIQVSAKDFDCLARNIFYEAGVEDHAAKVAVAQVTLNRVESGRWGDSICSVVLAKAQFSWTLNAKLRNGKPKGKLWLDSVTVASEFVSGTRVKGLEASMFYHTNYIRKPVWAHDMKVAHKVGQHIFYNKV